MIGRKSIVFDTSTVNHSDPDSSIYIVRIQANKNHGICDLILGTYSSKEVVDEKTKIKEVKTFFSPIRRLSELLSTFQGRQYDDPNVREHLWNVLREIL